MSVTVTAPNGTTVSTSGTNASAALQFIFDQLQGKVPVTGITGTLAPGQFRVLDAGHVVGVLPDGGFVTIGGAYSFLQGSGAGDTVVFAPTQSGGAFQSGLPIYNENALGSYTDVGGNNFVLFAHGSNIYEGSAATGSDTVFGGVGHDTIKGGASSNLIAYGGIGGSYIDLNDQDTSSSANASGNFSASGQAWILQGSSTVNARGQHDVIGALSSFNVLTDGSNTNTGTVSILLGGHDNFVQLRNSQTGSALSQRLQVVGDTGNNNLIQSGNGTLFYLSFASGEQNTTIHGGTGLDILFGITGSNIQYTDSGSATTFFISGGGTENFDASGSSNNLLFFGGASDNSTFIGGSGNDFFFTGTGNETLTGGAGQDFFQIDATGTANNILITDFGNGNDVVSFAGYTTDQVNAALAAATTTQVGGTSALVVTLPDNTVVTFVGVTNLDGHIFNG